MRKKSYKQRNYSSANLEKTDAPERDGRLATRGDLPEAAPAPEQLSLRWQQFLLPLAFLHFVAVFSEPFHFFSRSGAQTAPDAAWVRETMRPYAQFLFMDHGYFFFAPNPGPTHLLRIATSDDPLPTLPDRTEAAPYDAVPLQSVQKSDGDDVEAFTYPDRHQHWPRLLYHRYFMLSEFYYARYTPPQIAPELLEDAEIAEQWRNDRTIYTTIQSSVRDHAKQKFNKEFLRLDRLERELPPPNSVLKEEIRISDIRWLAVLRESLDIPPGESPRRRPPPRNLTPPAHMPAYVPLNTDVPNPQDRSTNSEPQFEEVEPKR